MKTLLFEIKIPDTADLVLAEPDYQVEAAKIAMQFKENLLSQMSPNPDAKLNAGFLRETMLLGMAFEATGIMLKQLSVKYAERGKFES